jgi:membrane protein implicated in regulation of membrane protease activity
VDGRELLVALFALGAVLLSWPFLAIFNSPRAVFGIPVLVAYLFTVWAAVVVVIFWLVRRRPGG